VQGRTVIWGGEKRDRTGTGVCKVGRWGEEGKKATEISREVHQARGG